MKDGASARLGRLSSAIWEMRGLAPCCAPFLIVLMTLEWTPLDIIFIYLFFCDQPVVILLVFFFTFPIHVLYALLCLFSYRQPFKYINSSALWWPYYIGWPFCVSCVSNCCRAVTKSFDGCWMALQQQPRIRTSNDQSTSISRLLLVEAAAAR